MFPKEVLVKNNFIIQPLEANCRGLNVVIIFLHGNSLEYVPKNWCREDKKFGWKHVFTTNEEVLGMYKYFVLSDDVIFVYGNLFNPFLPLESLILKKWCSGVWTLSDLPNYKIF